MKSFFEVMKKSAFAQNPIFVQLLGMCPTLAVTTSAKNGLAMGICVTLVLICSNFLISLVSRYIPATIRIASYIVIISAFVTGIQLLLQAYFPELHASLGIFIPLIVVNCIVLGRAEAFASKNKPLFAIADAIGTGLGFSIALVIVGAIRELIGNGTVFSGTSFVWHIPHFEPMTLFLLPAGGFFVLGFVIALVNALRSHRKAKQERKENFR